VDIKFQPSKQRFMCNCWFSWTLWFMLR